MFATLPVTALRTFEAAARLRSFKLAAAELAVTPTAVSHQIKALERHVGFALFERAPRSVRLTDKGARLF
ncbi:MAG: LysR family transcriptional regulator, partial [Achromobacter piechaudii]